ncbi:hypothetical protein [Aestuariibacter sp. A3R04]|uniref:hypothetical protein n=1 Tax=Aestuariibacter sp. A3R04 TaxID=2841571 RepID=UPI001C0934C1|nr:hypothetical protein [Aestuariibacter sp. A3R04]MBU3022362.1 hypothetical protein [Aestuariibacter sp. A3R04]
MKLLVFFISSTLSFTAISAANANPSNASQDTVKVQVVDYSGKPPFKREVIMLPVADVAKLENAQGDTPTEYAEVRTVVMRGKPPFRRTVETLPVYDVAQLDVVKNQPPVKAGKPPFKRH